MPLARLFVPLVLAGLLSAAPSRAGAATVDERAKALMTETTEAFGGLSRSVTALSRLANRYTVRSVKPRGPKGKDPKAVSAAFGKLRTKRNALRAEIVLRRKRIEALRSKAAALESEAGPGDSVARSYLSSLPGVFTNAPVMATPVLASDEAAFSAFVAKLQAARLLPLDAAGAAAPRFLELLDCDTDVEDPVEHAAELVEESRRIRPEVLRLIRDLAKLKPGKGTAWERYLSRRPKLREPLEGRVGELLKMKDQLESCVTDSGDITREKAEMFQQPDTWDAPRYMVLARAELAASEVTGLYWKAKQALDKEGARYAKAGASKAFRLPVDAPPKSASLPDKDAYAVVVGIEKYRGVTGVDYAARDAAVMRDYLTGAMGFPAENTILLDNENASKAELEKYLFRWLKNHATAKSRVFVFYAGHGAPDPVGGEAFLVPHDGDPNYLKETGLPVAKLFGALSSLPSRNVTVVLDACFSGAGGRSVLPKGARPLVMKIKSAGVGGNMVVLTAAEAKQISTYYPKARHGLLTYYLLKGLQGRADADKDRKITTRELIDYVRPNVKREARKQNIEQTPTTRPMMSPREKRASRVWMELK